MFNGCDSLELKASLLQSLAQSDNDPVPVIDSEVTLPHVAVARSTRSRSSASSDVVPQPPISTPNPTKLEKLDWTLGENPHDVSMEEEAPRNIVDASGDNRHVENTVPMPEPAATALWDKPISHKGPGFALLVCKAVLPFLADLLKKGSKARHQNKKVWDKVMANFFREHPEFREVKEVNRTFVQSIFYRYKANATSPTWIVPMNEGQQLLRDAIEKIRRDQASPQEAYAVEDIRRHCQVHRTHPLNTTKDENDDIIILDDVPSNSAKRPLSDPRPVPVSTMLKVLDICKRKNYGFEFNGNDMMFRDLDNPIKRICFPIDRLDHAC